jgi:hypothetical protein
MNSKPSVQALGYLVNLFSQSSYEGCEDILRTVNSYPGGAVLAKNLPGMAKMGKDGLLDWIQKERENPGNPTPKPIKLDRGSGPDIDLGGPSHGLEKRK